MKNEIESYGSKDLFSDTFEDTELDLVTEDVLKRWTKKLQKGPGYIVYPNDFEEYALQKVIITTSAYKYAPGTDGTEDRYIIFPAFSRGVYYGRAIIYDGCPFFIQVPFQSFFEMFYRTARIRFEQLIITHTKQLGEPPIYEIHFYKETSRTYTLTYLSLLQYMGKEQTEYGPKYNFKVLKKLYEQSPPKKVKVR